MCECICACVCARVCVSRKSLGAMYLHNDLRGCSYVFSFKAACQFLKNNNLLSVIRAHTQASPLIPDIRAFYSPVIIFSPPPTPSPAPPLASNRTFGLPAQFYRTVECTMPFALSSTTSKPVFFLQPSQFQHCPFYFAPFPACISPVRILCNQRSLG